MRVIPTIPRTGPIQNAVLLERASSAPLLKHKQFGALTSLNRRGVVAYDPGPPSRGGPAPLSWGTQLFPNGELWLASNTIIVRERGTPAKLDSRAVYPGAPNGTNFYEKTHAAVAFAVEQLGLKLP